MSLSIRVKKIRDHYSKNTSQFANLIGHDRPDTIRNIITGRTSDPKSSLINDILIACPEVNARWLITGEGEMLTRKEKKLYSGLIEEPNENYGFCMECVKKDARIELLNSQLKEKEEEIQALNREIGSLDNNSNGKSNKKAS